MKKKTGWLMLSCLVALSLVLAACAPAVEEEKEVVEKEVVEKEVVEKEVVEKEVVEKEVVAAVAGGPQYGGSLVILPLGSTADIPSWGMPGKYTYLDGYMYERFSGQDFDKGPRGTGEANFFNVYGGSPDTITGYLAESWELPDPGTIIYHLRQGVKYHDKFPVNGREMVAEDHVYVWENILMPSPYPSAYVWNWVSEVSAPDKYTFVIKMDEFWSNWEFDSGFGTGHQLIPREVWELGIENWRNAAGTGPFMLDDYVPASSITYVKNPNYWGTDTIDGKEYQLPFVDKLQILIVPDMTTRVAALRTGKVDVLHNIPWENHESIMGTNPDMQWVKYLSTKTELRVNFRWDVEPFGDIRVRKALNMAIDRQAIIDSYLGGDGVLLSYLIAPGEPGYTPLEELPASTRENFVYNPEKAMELLAEAGFPDGFPTEVVTSQPNADLLSMMVSYWADIGVEVAIKIVEVGQMTSIRGKPGLRSYDQGFAPGSNPVGLVLHHTIGNLQYWDNDNTTEWFSQEYMDLFNESTRAFDPEDKYEAWRQANLIFLNEANNIFVPGGFAYSYWQPWIGGHYGELTAGFLWPGPAFARMWLDEDMRREMVGR